MEEKNLQNLFLFWIAVILLFGVLKLLYPIAVPIAIACFLTAVLMPVINWLEGWKVPRIAIIPTIIILTAIGILLDISLLYISAEEVIRKAPVYLKKLQDVSLQVIDWMAKYDIEVDPSLFKFQEIFKLAIDFIASSISSIFSLLGSAVLIMLIIIFIIGEIDIFRPKIMAAFGDQFSAEID